MIDFFAAIAILGFKFSTWETREGRQGKRAAIGHFLWDARFELKHLIQSPSKVVHLGINMHAVKACDKLSISLRVV